MTLARDVSRVRPFGALPAIVAVHAVVAAADGPDASDADPLRSRCLELLEIPGGAARRRVAAIEDGMDDHLVGSQAVLPGQLEQREQVLMWLCTPPSESSPIRCSVLPVRCTSSIAFSNTGLRKKLPSRMATRDAHQVLVGDPPGAQVLVADLAVAHLAGRQSDGFARRLQQRVRTGRQQLVEHRQPARAAPRCRAAWRTRRPRRTRPSHRE